MQLLTSIAVLAALLTFARGQHQVALQPVYSAAQEHTGYAMRVKIGEIQTTFNVLLDTVIPKFWVVGTDCNPHLNPFCLDKSKYSKPDSKSGVYIRWPFDVNYGPKKFAKNLAGQWKDQISMDKVGGGSVQLNDVSFGTPVLVRWDGYQGIDGVFGLGPSADSYKILSPQEVIQNALSNVLITIALPPLNAGNAPNNRDAVLTLGGRDGRSCRLDTQLDETFIPEKNRYDFRISSMKIGGATLNFPDGTVAYPHASKSHIAVPTQIMKQIADNLHAQYNKRTGKYMVPCNGQQPFVLRSANNEYTVDQQHFIIRRNANDQQCELAFTARKGTGNAVALGLPFLHQFCTILHPSARRIGFARLV